MEELAQIFGSRDKDTDQVVREARWTNGKRVGGAGDSVRLHERSNALKGEPQERIWHEIGPADSGRTKAPGG